MLRVGHGLFLWLTGCRSYISVCEPFGTRLRSFKDSVDCDARVLVDIVVWCKAKGLVPDDPPKDWSRNANNTHDLCHNRLAITIVSKPHFPVNFLCGIQLADIYLRNRADNFSGNDSPAVCVFSTETTVRFVRRAG